MIIEKLGGLFAVKNLNVHIFRRVRKISKKTFSFVMSVYPAVRMEQLGSQKTDFHEILYMSQSTFLLIQVMHTIIKSQEC